MAVNIGKAQAERVLSQAFGSECLRNDNISEAIRNVLNGGHKTYKYLLITGLLAKATDVRANALTLQSGSELEGAYDARTLCHKVLVPFERDFLHNALGGSNEPFLNKPARFKEISITNAVRKGNDTITRDALIAIFNSIDTSEEAFAYLACALYFLNESIERQKKLGDSSISYNPTLVDIYGFIQTFLTQSFEGETCALVIGALETIYYSRIGEEYLVKPHKVNQSGASSKETGDIDIFKDGELLCAIEVKDKDFNVYDLEHSFVKMIQSGAKKGEFIYGTRAGFDADLIFDRVAKFEEEGFYVLFHSVHTYSKMLLYKAELSSKSEFVDTLFAVAKEINCRESTFVWAQQVLKDLGWKE